MARTSSIRTATSICANSFFYSATVPGTLRTSPTPPVRRRQSKQNGSSDQRMLSVWRRTVTVSKLIEKGGSERIHLIADKPYRSRWGFVVWRLGRGEQLIRETISGIYGPYPQPPVGFDSRDGRAQGPAPHSGSKEQKININKRGHFYYGMTHFAMVS